MQPACGQDTSSTTNNNNNKHMTRQAVAAAEAEEAQGTCASHHVYSAVMQRLACLVTLNLVGESWPCSGWHATGMPSYPYPCG